MKRQIAFLSLFAMASLAACSPIGEGTRESCVGPYTGTFEITSRDYGPVEGRILAEFAAPDVQTEEPALELSLTFDTETAEEIPDMPMVANVAETGEITRRSGSFDFEGSFNLDDCEASGTFSADPIYTNGTWRLSTGHSAY